MARVCSLRTRDAPFTNAQPYHTPTTPAPHHVQHHHPSHAPPQLLPCPPSHNPHHRAPYPTTSTLPRSPRPAAAINCDRCCVCSTAFRTLALNTTANRVERVPAAARFPGILPSLQMAPAPLPEVRSSALRVSFVRDVPGKCCVLRYRPRLIPRHATGRPDAVWVRFHGGDPRAEPCAAVPYRTRTAAVRTRCGTQC